MSGSLLILTAACIPCSISLALTPGVSVLPKLSTFRTPRTCRICRRRRDVAIRFLQCESVLYPKMAKYTYTPTFRKRKRVLVRSSRKTVNYLIDGVIRSGTPIAGQLAGCLLSLNRRFLIPRDFWESVVAML